MIELIFPPIFVALLPIVAWFSREGQKQKELFGEVPTIEDSVARYCRDKGLLALTAS